MSSALSQLDSLLAEVVDLRNAVHLMGWDERVCMPPGGVDARGEMVATIRRIEHEKFTSDTVGRLLERAKGEAKTLDPDAPASRKLRVIARDYDKATRVPPDFVAEQARVTAAAHQAWREARERSDFKIFVPHLSRIVDLKQRYVGFYPSLDHPYDALVDDFEPGARTAEIKKMFDVLRSRQVALVQAMLQRPQPDDAFLRGAYPETELLAFAVEVISRFGFDWHRGRQDKSAHPFATAMSPGDVRITTRFVDHQPFELFFSTLHETGHALYEQGIDAQWTRSPVSAGASLGMHESQSRLWENVIGRSMPFWSHFFPLLQRRFRSELASVTLDQFYRAINKVQPSLIRVEADEVTYNLHVMLRVEIEIALLTGSIRADQAEEFWNGKMREYLDLTPTSAATGILQDMHWSIGLMGYFPTYTIGNVISVQLWNRYRAAEPKWEEQLRDGDFAALRTWLQREIHQHGRSYEPAELVMRTTGGPIDPGPYLDYLEQKYL